MLLLLVVLQSLALSSGQLFNCYNLSTIPPPQNGGAYLGELSAQNLLNVQTYDAGAKYSISLMGSDDVPYLTIVQARVSSGYYTTVGQFIASGTQQSVVSCRSQNDTLIIINESLVTFLWKAPDTKVEAIAFHYTVKTLNGTYRIDSRTKVIYPRSPLYISLIKAHGGLMIVAWCLLAPCAILLSLFYKPVCIRGEWFYMHIAIQVLTMLLNIAAIAVIFTYGRFNGHVGSWTLTSILNWPHQVIGLFTFLILLVNPFLAICRCHQDSSMRWIFNYIHGGIGVVALLSALTVMLLGLNIYKTLVGYTDYSHYAIYSLAGTIAVILITIALYNIYALNFNIRSAAKNYIDEDAPSSDWCCRVVIAILVTSLLAGGTLSTLVMIGLA